MLHSELLFWAGVLMDFRVPQRGSGGMTCVNGRNRGEQHGIRKLGNAQNVAILSRVQ